ncbi:hypothetical protein KA005_39370 [bacterium]|nr:hypothetical protein [bacterium]
MKTLTFISTIVLSLSLTFSVTMISGQNQFKTQEEAIQKAKENFAIMIESGIGDFGVSAEEIKSAEALAVMTYKQADFMSLLDTINLESFTKIRSSMMNYVVPLTLNARIVAVIQINKHEDGWSIVGMGNTALGDALNSLPEDIKNESLPNITIYDIPNIIATVYVLELRAAEVCFTDYAQFDLDAGEEPREVLLNLHMEAVKFQEKYGDTLKEKKLTN